MKKKLTKTKPSVSSKKRRKKIPIFILLAPVLAIFLIVFFYIMLVMPVRLSSGIKNDMIGIFKPLDIDEENEYIIVKLKTIPDEKTQDYFIEKVNSSYDLDPGFEKISADANLPVYKINFFKGKSLYENIKEIYVFWNNMEVPDELIDMPYNDKTVRIEKAEKEIVKEQKKGNMGKSISERLYVKRMEPEKRYNAEKQVLKKKERPDEEKFAKIAIVLDDVGYDYKTTYDYLSLDFPVTFSIIPGMKESDKFYKLIKNKRFDFMLHIPMEPEKGSRYVEKNAVLVNMSDDEISERIRGFLREYPGAKGANNHMGSKAVSDTRIMNVIIGELSEKKMYWLDSMTTLNSTAKSAAAGCNVRYFERNIFLDNEDDYDSIKKSMEKLINEAKIYGSAVGIGHVQSKTLGMVLKEFYKNSANLKIKFVNLNDL